VDPVPDILLFFIDIKITARNPELRKHRGDVERDWMTMLNKCGVRVRAPFKRPRLVS
jgi:hypothetical protein